MLKVKGFILLSFILLFVTEAFSLTEPPCAYPPFLTLTVTPNVLIILDNSGSMNWQAYYGNYDPNKRYYGYADPDKHYRYQSNVFEVTTTWSGTADPAHKRYSGNFLNWMAMRRVDIARKVLVGGKCESRTGHGPKILVGEKTDSYSSRQFYKYWGNWLLRLYGGYIYVYKRRYGRWYYQHKCIVKIRGPEVVEGFIQRTSDRIRYGLEFFNYGSRYEQGRGRDGGYMADYMGTGATIQNIVNNWD